MARKHDRFEESAKNLISHLTEIEEEDENFDLCLQFALSNFRFHRFLDVDSHKMTRVLEGVREKFLIHSQQEKADVFKKLTEKFLESPVFEHRTEGKTDTHYALLSLLLHLADSPTQSDYSETHAQILSESEDNFDWVAYLREGEEDLCTVYPESPDWSDEELPVAKSSHHDSGIVHEEASQHVAFKDEIVPDSFEGYSTNKHSDDWLKRNVIVQYWKGAIRLDNASSYSSSNLAVDWEHYLSRINPLYSPMQKTVLTEHHVVREVLWMLSGIDELFIYNRIDDHYIVKDDLMLSHLTDTSLHSLLSTLATYGGVVLKFHRFIQETSVSSQSCQTYQAFAAALSGYLKKFNEILTGVEKIMIQQDEVVTLAYLLKHLEGKFQELDAFHAVFQLGIEECSEWTSVSQKACHLLSIMYDLMMEWDIFGSNEDMVNLILPIWIQTSRPYLDIIDEWITHGNLLDPAKEFVIQKNEDIQSLDENFWETAFTLHLSNMSVNTTVEDITAQSKEEYFTTTWAPRFLQPVLDKIILAGKSMEMLQNLGRLSEVVGAKTIPLYTKFIQSLQENLAFKSPREPECEVVEVKQPDDQGLAIFTNHIQQQMKLKGVHDLLLDLNFKAIINPHEFKAEQLSDKHEEIHRSVSRLSVDSLNPIRVLLEQCLYPHVMRRYERVCKRLLELLKTDYNLLKHMSSMRKIFLMESGDTMYDFYRDIFEKLRLHEPWRDLSSLNINLQEALHAHHQHLISSLVVGVENPKSKTRNKQPISALDGLTLHYKVPWPIDVVINSKCQRAYNQIFTFLLQIKRAKYCLDELCFYDLEKESFESHSFGDTFTGKDASSRSSNLHKVEMFRMRLLHFVNSLHNYIMTRILHSTGLEFQSDLEKAADLDEVIVIHNAYVCKIHERCLLHKKVAFVKEAVLKVLNLAPAFQNLWDDGIEQISMKVLVEMEVEFNRCLKFLTSFLNNVIKRGSFPHLEVLAFSLVTSGEYSAKQETTGTV